MKCYVIHTSPFVQNQVLDIGNYVRQKVLSQVSTAPMFTIIADEVTDCSNKEQLSLVLRNVDRHCNIFCKISSYLLSVTLVFLEEILQTKCSGVDLTKLCGQACDSAGCMAGKTNGAAAFISAEYPLALYLHCALHCLNLSFVKSLENTSIRNMMGIVNRVWVFFASHPKRQKKLEQSIKKTQPKTKVHKLKDLYLTRWIQRIDALDRFQILHPSIVRLNMLVHRTAARI